MNKITVNKIRCRKCGDIIESKSVHDFRSCKCGSVAVDGKMYLYDMMDIKKETSNLFQS